MRPYYLAGALTIGVLGWILVGDAWGLRLAVAVAVAVALIGAAVGPNAGEP